MSIEPFELTVTAVSVTPPVEPQRWLASVWQLVPSFGAG
jgi:hypothetical protein